MKPVKISFIQHKLHPWIWGVAALIACALLAAFMTQADHIRSEMTVQNRELQEIQTMLQTLQTTTPSSSSESLLGMDAAKKRQASQIAQLLQSDLGKALRTLETLKIPAVKLRNLTIDNAQGLIDIDVELANLEQVSVLSQALAAGYTKSPWVLISATAQSASPSGSQSSIPVSFNSIYLGKWRAKLAEL
jgi:hypothetical protein